MATASSFAAWRTCITCRFSRRSRRRRPLFKASRLYVRNPCGFGACRHTTTRLNTLATRLIVNADDYGLTEGVSEGIRRAHLDGILTTTTAMMNMPSVMADLKLGRELCPNLGFGVHLVLTQGKPVRPPEKVPTLVRRDGRFYSVLQIIEAVEGMNPVELRDEWRAQIERFLETGIPIDHIDSHHHVVMRNEHTLRVALDLASEYGVAIRNPFIRPELESVASAL